MIVGTIAGAIAVAAISAVAGYRILDKGNDTKVATVVVASVNVADASMVNVPREECSEKPATRTGTTRDPNQETETVCTTFYYSR